MEKGLHARAFAGRATATLCLAAVALATAALALSGGCRTVTIRPNSRDYQAPVKMNVIATGYCNCQKCCDWRYTWYGKPVHASGKQKGRGKKVGLTASGTRAHPGTIAADTSIFPFGTIIEIPGYGYGKVEDRGGAIKDKHIDLWFRHHEDARQWGRQQKQVKVWLPKKRK